MTLFAVGDFLVDQHARAMSVHEAVFHAKPQSENVPQLEAEADALKAVVDYQTYRATEARWEFRIWIGLTLLGAALFAEREQRDTSLPNRAG
jgi:hypothetical protein